jgi:hypothetical protein
LPYLTDLALGEAALRDGDDETDLTAVLTTVGASERVVSNPVRTNPYVGLEAFDTKDAAHFYGRERLVDELAARVTSRRSCPAVHVPRGTVGQRQVERGPRRAGAADAGQHGRADHWLVASPGRPRPR